MEQKNQPDPPRRVEHGGKRAAGGTALRAIANDSAGPQPRGMVRLALSRLVLLGFLLAPLAAQEPPVYRTPSPALAAIVDAPLPPTVAPSPDRRTLLLLERPDAPTIAQLAQPELKLAGLRIDPATNGRSRDTLYTALILKGVDGSPERRIRGLPAGSRIGDYEWSRDSRHIAFTLVRERGLELWLLEVSTGKVRKLTDPILNAVFGEPMSWLDDATLVIRRTPARRGPAPAALGAPTGPIVQENRGGQRASARTYDGLLASPTDEALFDHYGTSELALVSLRGRVTALPVRGLLTFVAASPDGQHLLVQSLRRPYSYLVPSSRFPAALDVYDRAGKPEHHLADLALWEGGTSAAVRPGPRGVTWRADAPATLSWVQSLGREGERKRPPERDAWYTLAAPFAGAPVQQQRFEYRVGTVQWCDDELALVTETWSATRVTRTWKVAPGRPGSPRTLLFERKTEDRYSDPGRPETTRNPYGRIVLQRSADGSKIYLAGAGASDEGDRPFLDEYDLATRQARRLWRSAPPDYEEFVSFLDSSLQRGLVFRESPTSPTNYFVRDFATGTLTPLTATPNPYPQFNDIRREVVRYRRADGVALSGTLYLPPGWTPEQGRLPVLLWAYPREFLSADAAAQVKATPERFSRVSATGPLPFLLAGYAVLNDPAMPIVAAKGKKPNDTYIEQLVASAQAAVDELVRRGVADRDRVAVGGHSYGAFMTANLLAHSRLFRAGIARSGAYNRTLTPFGFQSEQRTLWQARDVYAAMSPFNFADRVKDPILLIHGAADDNSGTFPIQSERFYNALKSHGATARLVFLPHEAHSYRARESLLHMLWEMETWLDANVKSAPARPAPAPHEAKPTTAALAP